MTQCERVVQYCKDFGSITTLQAFTDLGVTRLASRINDLKKQGYVIKSEFVTTFNRCCILPTLKHIVITGSTINVSHHHNSMMSFIVIIALLPFVHYWYNQTTFI
jgi:hypothetical protein